MEGIARVVVGAATSNPSFFTFGDDGRDGDGDGVVAVVGSVTDERGGGGI